MLLRRHNSVKAVEKTAITVKKEEEKKYSKSDISRMSTADLKSLAPTLVIDVT